MIRRFGLLLTVLLIWTVGALHGPIASATASTVTSTEHKTLIYDEAGLLNPQEVERLGILANEYSANRETDMIVYTTNNPENTDVILLTQNFYDERAPGYDHAHGNAVILTLDMYNRDVYLAGFYKAEEYLDNGRLDKIRARITPRLSSGDYAEAFQIYLQTADRYMGYPPGMNPDNILFNGWFQLIVSLAVGGGAVAIMAYRSGGRITVNGSTYEDSGTSGILQRRDQYLHTTTTKTPIPKNNSSGGGGGGTTGGGHSHSGSRGSF